MSEAIRKTFRSRPITLAGPATSESLYTAWELSFTMRQVPLMPESLFVLAR